MTGRDYQHKQPQAHLHTACMHACMHAYIHTYVHAYTHILHVHYLPNYNDHVHEHMHAWLPACIMLHTHTYRSYRSMPTYMRTYRHRCTNAHTKPDSGQAARQLARIWRISRLHGIRVASLWDLAGHVHHIPKPDETWIGTPSSKTPSQCPACGHRTLRKATVVAASHKFLTSFERHHRGSASKFTKTFNQTRQQRLLL